jgi:arabinofuranosyltransferase
MTGRRLLIAFGGAFCLVILVRTAWLSELSYLTLRTVEHAASGYGLRWNINERVQVFDHPLWTLLLLAGRLLTGETYYTTFVISLGLSAATVILVLQSAAAAEGVVLGAVLLATSWAFVSYSTSGLEGPLAHLLIVLFCRASLLPRRRSRGTTRAAALAGVAGITHPATLVVTLPALLGRAAWRRDAGPLTDAHETRDGQTEQPHGPIGAVRDGEGRAPTEVGPYRAEPGRSQSGQDVAGSPGSWLLACGPLLAWGLFAAFYYGTPVPTPVLAEWTEHAGVLNRVAAAGRMFAYAVRHDPITIAVILAGITLAWRGGSHHRALATGLAGYIAVLALWAGDGMPGRWLALPFLVTTMLVGQQPAVERPLVFGGTLAVALALAAVPSLTTIRSDVRFGTPSELSPGRDSRASDYRATGLLLDIRQWYPPTHPEAKRGDVAWQDPNRVRTSPHPAFFAFAAGYGVHVIDVTGRTDPLLARMPPGAGTTFPSGAPRSVPEGYVASLPNRRNAIASRTLAAYYDRVRLVTRGPLLDPWRLVAAARLAFENPAGYGGHDPPERGDQGDHRPPEGGHYGDRARGRGR